MSNVNMYMYRTNNMQHATCNLRHAHAKCTWCLVSRRINLQRQRHAMKDQGHKDRSVLRLMSYLCTYAHAPFFILHSSIFYLLCIYRHWHCVLCCMRCAIVGCIYICYLHHHGILVAYLFTEMLLSDICCITIRMQHADIGTRRTSNCTYLQLRNAKSHLDLLHTPHHARCWF